MLISLIMGCIWNSRIIPSFLWEKKRNEKKKKNLPRRDENSKWKRLDNEQFHTSYRSRNIFTGNICRRISWTEHVISVLEILGNNTIGKRTLGRIKGRRENNIRIHIFLNRSIQRVGLIRLRIDIIAELFCMWLWTAGFYKSWS